MFIIGFLLPFMIFNSIGLGALNVNIIYIYSLCFCFFRKNFKLSRRYNNIFIFLIIILFIQSFLFVQFPISTLIKLSTSMLFFNILYNYQHLLGKLVKGYVLGMQISIFYAFYQFIIIYKGLDLVSYFASINILWNNNLWHHNIVRDGIIRVASFALEPAFFNIFLSLLVLIFAFNREVPGINLKQVKISLYNKMHINASLNFTSILLVPAFLASFSRNGLAFAAFFSLEYLLRKKFSRQFFLLCFFASFFIPLLIPFLFNFYELDSSVIARFAPLKIFFASNKSNLLQICFGVPNYTGFIESTSDFARFREIFISEQVNIDAKSFTANLLYDYGLLGFLGFISLTAYNFYSSKKALILIATFNFVAFNVNLLYWPIYWVAYLLAIVIKKNETNSDLLRSINLKSSTSSPITNV